MWKKEKLNTQMRTQTANKQMREGRSSGRKSLRRGSPLVTAVPPLTDLNIKSILVPTDLSAESEKALAYALPFARQFGATLTLLHVVEPVGTPDFAKSFPLFLENDKMTANCKRHLQGI